MERVLTWRHTAANGLLPLYLMRQLRLWQRRLRTRRQLAALDFTPDRPAILQGQMYIRVATTAKDPLTVTCMAIEDEGGAGSLFICADICGVPDALLARVRALLHRDVAEADLDDEIRFHIERETEANIAGGRYPMVRPLYYILKENYKGLGSGFTNFLIYEKGQLIFQRAYLLPARMQFEVREMQIAE